MKIAISKARRHHFFNAVIIVALLIASMPLMTAHALVTNVALNKAATCSSTENAGTACAAAVDGNTGTRWASAFSDPQWIQVDLGATYALSSVTLRWETAAGKNFQIQGSGNGTTWTTLATVTNGTGGNQTLTVTGSYRYVRMYGTARTTGYGYSLWELEIYGDVPTTPTTPVPTTPAPSTNIALNKATSCSSIENAGTPCAGAVDGNATATRWASAFADPQWLQVDFGGTQTINRVVLKWEAAYGKAYQIQISNDAANWTTLFTTTTGDGGTDDLAISGTGRYLRMYGTVRATGYGYSLYEIEAYNSGPVTVTPSITPSITPSPAVCAQPANPNFGPNVRIFDPSMSAATIQAQLDADFNLLKDTLSAQFSENRRAHLFKPGTYNVYDNVGFYTSVAGLGQNPGDVVINGAVTVDAFNASDAGNATQNFWRSAENLTINTNGGSNRWGVAQAAPFRRINVLGDLDLYPASYGWASGGYISDVKVSGNAETASQQQWYSKDSNFGSWSGSVWNMVFSGVTGAPAASFPNPPMTVLGTTPVSRDVPYLYVDGTGAYRVFLPALRTNASGTSWPNTPGTSLSITQFYVVVPGTSAATINSALNQGCHLLFTPGIYHVNQTINVTRANTVVLGIGYPTIVNDNGVNAMQVADVDGVRLKGLLFDAGLTNAAAQLVIGTAGNTTSRAANPVTVQDVFFRIGGQFAGKITTSLIVNSNDTIIDHIWAWRGDHGAGIGWTSNTADTGLIVNANNVLATGLFVEHYQKHEVIWNGQGGKIIFFQNERPYDPPSQAAWMNGTTRGYAAIKVADTVTSFEAWGLGSYCYFNVDPTVVAERSFESPNNPNVRWHNMSTVSLGGVGVIAHVINNIGAATASSTTPSTVISYP